MNLNRLAKSTGFIKRNRKISAKDFLFGLCFSTLTQKERSLIDITNDMDCSVSKVGVHKKFTEKAVDFVREVLSELIVNSLNLAPVSDSCPKQFSQINIKDSTKISLPKQFIDEFPSYGGFNHTSTSLLNIQFEFNLLNNSWKELKFTKVTQNDQSESRDTLEDIVAGSLNIRDLGYITLKYLKAVEDKKAFYVNRLHKVNVYQKEGDEYKQIDWCKYEKDDRKRGFTQVRELEVYLGKEKLKTRLIIAPFPENLKAEKVRKAVQGGKRSKKSTKYNISDQHKSKLSYTLMITNIPKEKMDAESILKTYSLRWQVELIFKAWKSNLKISQVKTVNINRMKCELYCKLIFALLSSNVAGICNYHLIKQNGSRKRQVSYPKLFKFLKTRLYKFKKVIIEDLESWVIKKVIPICKKLAIEKKKDKTPSFIIIDKVNFALS